MEVTDVVSTDLNSFLSSRKARLRVEESFGGLSAGVAEVDVFTGRGGGDCGIPFQPGESYLVDGFVAKDGSIHADLCSSTRRSQAMGAGLRILRARRDGQRVPSLAGRIVQLDRNFDGLFGVSGPHILPNTLIRVRSASRSREIRADAEGVYAFYDLPRGKYQFDADLPPGTKISWYIGSERPEAPFEITGIGCQERDIAVFPKGSIQGRVLDSSNRPLPHVFVYIIPAAMKGLPRERQLYWESQGKEGFFKFVHIPPGEYLVLVNPEDLKNAKLPYGRTFHPGVRDRSEARVITVRAGEQVKDVDILLQP